MLRRVAVPVVATMIAMSPVWAQRPLDLAAARLIDLTHP